MRANNRAVVVGLADTMYSLALFQLRHHTKNTLQRVLLDLHETAASCDSRVERRLLTAFIGRIKHSTAIADALFGVTRSQAPFADRFQTICDSTLALLASDDQVLTLRCAMEGVCPAPLETALLRVTKELVGNAVKHGMQLRLEGRIDVVLRCESRCEVELLVRDDGWGPPDCPVSGEGLAIVREFVELLRGDFTLTRERDTTVARVLVPVPRG